ncbi:BQ2448_889 [Microbotryum intermedium]|uniref:BQ2448_889 protein n=1 Tax=Microbotryum intermedium TaxID=269621 RepID=A0A238FC94_9BASI|nr:BQ2448_889 [Microbotryum intermedium]
MDPSGHYSDYLDFSGFDTHAAAGGASSQSLPTTTLPAPAHTQHPHPPPPLQPHSQPGPTPLAQHHGGMFDTTGMVNGEHFLWPINGGGMAFPDAASFLFASTATPCTPKPASSPTISSAARIPLPPHQRSHQQLTPFPPTSASPHDPSSPVSILQQQLQQQHLQMQMQHHHQQQQQWQQLHQTAAQGQQLFRPSSGPPTGDVGTSQGSLGHIASPAAMYQQSLQHQTYRSHHAGGGLTPSSSAGVASAWNTPSPASSASASHTPAAAGPPPPLTTTTNKAAKAAPSSTKDYRPPKKQARLVQPPPVPPPVAQPSIRPAVQYPASSTPVELIPDASPPTTSTSRSETRYSPTKTKGTHSSFASPDSPSRPRLRRTPSDPLLGSNKARSDRDKLTALFTLLDENTWSVEDMLVALSDVPSEEAVKDDVESSEHRKRMMQFLHRQTSVGKTAEQTQGPEEIYRRWIVAREGGDGDDKIMGLDGLYRSMGSEQHGSIIRNILTKDSVPYEEAQADIKMVDAALSRAPSHHALAVHSRELSSPTSSSGYIGRLIIPSDQADILGAWLMSPGRPALANEKDSITPEHMRIYSSLSPFELHARGAELCRVILMRDAVLKTRYGHLGDKLESFVQGPSIVPAKRCGFHEYDDYSLWHHALMSYLQICTRYPSFRDSKPATIDIIPDQSLLPPTLLEISLIERALHVHWETFRQYLLGEGGLLRRAVKAFSGVKTRPMDLMLICDDASAVMHALKKSQKEAGAGERILPYDPRVSEARNAWRQSAYWSENSHIMMWSAMTSHFLEISALYPRFSEGVVSHPLLSSGFFTMRDLPGLEGLLNGIGSDKPTNGTNAGGSK